jgi:glycosyltransferase involved in cell wall biosynthesis
MNIFHLTASRFFGGPERQMLGLAEALRPELRTCFLSFSEGGLCQSFLDRARQAGFEAIALRCDTPWLLATLRELTRVLRDGKADVLCCHGYKANLLGLLAARRLEIPVIAVSRGWTSESRRVRLYEALDRRILRWVDKVVCVSHGQADKVRLAGVRDERIAVIHNAIRPGRFDHPDPTYRERLCGMFPTPPSLIVGAAGRLSPEKGFAVLIDAAAQVLRKFDIPVPHVPARTFSIGFILFGDGPLRDALAQQICDRGLTDRFVLAGFRDDLDRYLPYLDLMVLPSFTEGLPNVALEALAAGVPVVATDVGGTPEVVEDGHCGRLVPAGDVKSLAEAVRFMLLDDRRRLKMGAVGPDRVDALFSFERQARCYEQLFESLVRPTRQAARSDDLSCATR